MVLVACVVLSLVSLLFVLPLWAFADAFGHEPRERYGWWTSVVLLWPLGALGYGVLRSRGRLLRAFTLVVAVANGAIVWVGQRNQAADTGTVAPTLDHYAAVRETKRLRLTDVFGSYGAPGNDDYVQALSLSSDGERLLVSGGRTLRLWDLDTKRVIATYESLPANDVLAGWLHGKWLGRASVAALSPDGRRVAAARANTTIRLGFPLLSFLRDALAGGGHAVDVWAVDGTASSIRAHDANVTALQLTKDQLFSASYDGAFVSWDPSSGERMRRVDTQQGWIAAAALSPDGGLALVSARKPYRATSARGHLGLWDVSTGARAHVLSGHDDRVHAVAFTADGARALSASFDGFRVWDVATGDERRFVPGNDAVFDVAFSGDGRYALAGSRALYLWDLELGEIVDTIPLENSRDEATAAVFSEDGTFIVVGTERGALLRFRR